jgi:transposase InsO family protein
LPWKVKTVSDTRLALCHSVRTGLMPVALAARRFGVSRKTAYKWLKIFDRDPCSTALALGDRSRRPCHSPRRTVGDIQDKALELRDRHNWGARKIHFVLRRESCEIPSIRTLSSILARNGRIKPPVADAPLQRFERAEPNELWQVDFKGPVEVDRQKIMPLTILDDHSRYLLAFKPCTNLTMNTAWNVLWDVFGQVGLPQQILCDNAFNARSNFRPAGLSWFDSRLVRLGIRPSHGRPYHPQTQGKVEALHRSATRELLEFKARKDNPIHFEQDCDSYRHLYNTVRPHQALGDVPPILRYKPSSRSRPLVLPEVTYPAGSVLRRVNDHGRIRFKNYRILCGQGIDGDLVRIEERNEEIAVYYCSKQIRCISHDQLKKDIIL